MKRTVVSVLLCIVLFLNAILVTACSNVVNVHKAFNDIESLEKLVEMKVIDGYDIASINEQIDKVKAESIINIYLNTQSNSTKNLDEDNLTMNSVYGIFASKLGVSEDAIFLLLNSEYKRVQDKVA